MVCNRHAILRLVANREIDEIDDLNVLKSIESNGCNTDKIRVFEFTEMLFIFHVLIWNSPKIQIQNIKSQISRNQNMTRLVRTLNLQIRDNKSIAIDWY